MKKERGLSSVAINGLSWSSLEYISVFLLQIFQLSFLARILDPKDFGIFAIGTFFSSLGNSVFALGLGPSLIQKGNRMDDYFDSAWTLNLMVSILAFFLLLFICPFIISFVFKEPNALLSSICTLSIVLISGFNNIRIVKYMKDIELKMIYFFHIIPRLVSIIVMVSLAFIIKSYWVLVFGLVSEYLLRVLLSFYLIPIKPRFEFDLVKFKELYSFGGWLQLKNLTTWVAGYFDTAIVGNVLDTSVLGFYNRAHSLSKIPEAQINKVVNVVTFPLFVRIREDKRKIQSTFEANFNFVLLFMFPLLLMVFLHGNFLVELGMGKKWLNLVNTFQILIVGVAIQSIVISFFPILRALGFPKHEFVLNLVKIGVLICFSYPLIKHFGINGAASAVLLANVIGAPLVLYLVKKKANLKYGKIFVSFISSLIVLLGSISISFFVRSYFGIPFNMFQEFISMILEGIFFFGCLFLLYYVFKIGPMSTFYELILKRNSKNKQ